MTTLTLKERWIFSVILPICVLIVGYFLVLATAQNAGSSIGFRAIGAFIALPIVVLLTFVINFIIAFPWKKSRLSSFAVGVVVPIVAIIIEYVYLWQVWKQYPDIG
jgi:hypothetical protein